MQSHLAYKDLCSNPRAYQLSLAALFGQRAQDEAAKRRRTPTPAKVDLTPVQALIERATAAALAVVNELVPNARHSDNRWCDWHPNRKDYRDCKSKDERVCAQNHDRVMLACRSLQLLEAGHLDPVEAAIADAVVTRTMGAQNWPETLNDTGLAKLDVVLRDAARTIKPLLAKQGSLLQ